MTHAGIPGGILAEMGISKSWSGLVRVENVRDLIRYRAGAGEGGGGA